MEAPVIIDLPSTTTGAVGRKLVDLRDTGGAIALGRVLTLVIVTDEVGAEEAIEAANSASREHPCRVIVIVQGNKRGVDRLDAQIRVGGDAGASEVIVLRLYGKLATHGDSVVTPLLLPDSPLVAWWPTDAPAQPVEDPIGAMAQRRITDAATARNPRKELERRRDAYAAGDTDLAWTRVTKWRGLLAAALDQPPYQPIEHITVSGASDSPSTDLLAAWLAECLRCPVTRVRGKAGTGMYSVRLERRGGPIDLVRADGTIATLSQPGQPDRRISLPRRSLAECLAEELRRLDPDEVYQAALSRGLARLDAGRTVSESQAASDGRTPSAEDVHRRTRHLIDREDRVAEAIAGSDPEGTGERAAQEAAESSGKSARSGTKSASKSTSKSTSKSASKSAAKSAGKSAAKSAGNSAAKSAGTSSAESTTKSAAATSTAKKSASDRPAGKRATRASGNAERASSEDAQASNGRQAAAASSGRRTTTRRTAAGAASSAAPSSEEAPGSASAEGPNESARVSGSDDVS
jgi:glucose-6-phosphate dehydrogenase assembly protein OpcA